MHVGSYNAESWLPSTFDQCIEKIPYIKSLGVSAVKLMPVNEFPGDRSWGYNPSDPYAIEASFGGPDGLKRFVKACHENGLAVLIDVVHNHYGPSDLEMWQYDGWSTGGYGGIYFYNDWKANTDWGSTRPTTAAPKSATTSKARSACSSRNTRWTASAGIPSTTSATQAAPGTRSAATCCGHQHR
jgi:1,4-alpha-glucan branching enzyme